MRCPCGRPVQVASGGVGSSTLDGVLGNETAASPRTVANSPGRVIGNALAPRTTSAPQAPRQNTRSSRITDELPYGWTIALLVGAGITSLLILLAVFPFHRVGAVQAAGLAAILPLPLLIFGMLFGQLFASFRNLTELIGWIFSIQIYGSGLFVVVALSWLVAVTCLGGAVVLARIYVCTGALLLQLFGQRVPICMPAESFKAAWEAFEAARKQHRSLATWAAVRAAFDFGDTSSSASGRVSTNGPVSTTMRRQLCGIGRPESSSRRRGDELSRSRLAANGVGGSVALAGIAAVIAAVNVVSLDIDRLADWLPASVRDDLWADFGDSGPDEHANQGVASRPTFSPEQMAKWESELPGRYHLKWQADYRTPAALRGETPENSFQSTAETLSPALHVEFDNQQWFLEFIGKRWSGPTDQLPDLSLDLAFSELPAEFQSDVGRGWPESASEPARVRLRFDSNSGKLQVEAGGFVSYQPLTENKYPLRIGEAESIPVPPGAIVSRETRFVMGQQVSQTAIVRAPGSPGFHTFAFELERENLGGPLPSDSPPVSSMAGEPDQEDQAPGFAPTRNVNAERGNRLGSLGSPLLSLSVHDGNLLTSYFNGRVAWQPSNSSQGADFIRASGMASRRGFVCLLPDGTRFISAAGQGAESRVRLASLAKPDQVLREFSIGANDSRNDGGYFLDLQVARDGRRALATYWNGVTNAIVLDLDSGETLLRRAVQGGLPRLSPDGDVVALRVVPNETIVWKVSTSQSSQPLPSPASGWSNASAVSELGRLFAVAAPGGSILVYGVAVAEPVSVLVGHSRDVVDMTFSPSGNALASIALDGTTRVWDTQTGAEMARFDWSHESEIPAEAKLWTDTVNNNRDAFPRHQWPPMSRVAFAADETIAWSLPDGAVAIRELTLAQDSGDRLVVETDRGPRLRPSSDLWSAYAPTPSLQDEASDSRRNEPPLLDNAAIVHPSDETHSIVVIRSPDQPPYLSVVDGALQEVARLQFPTGVDEFELTAVAFAHNRESLAVTDGSSVWLYKLLKGPPTRTMSREERWCRTLSFSPDDKFIVADGQGVFVMDTTRLDMVHELPDGRELWKLEVVEAESDDDESTTTRARAPTAGTRSRSSHADTRYRMKLSTVGEDLWEIHFDLTSLVRERRLSLLSPVTSTTTNATGNLLLVAESPTQCLVVDVDDFESLTYFRKPGMVRLSPDRDRIAWVGNVISFHDADSGARLAETLPKES
ncbi:MAG: WD40 repeat domain-containing protein, partial [Planctomycetales bacterium]|nr:WD40 repeat domain-containing protein [Planctomycetales bacterium]